MLKFNNRFVKPLNSATLSSMHTGIMPKLNNAKTV